MQSEQNRIKGIGASRRAVGAGRRGRPGAESDTYTAYTSILRAGLHHIPACFRLYDLNPECLIWEVQEGEDDWWDAEEPPPEGDAPDAAGDAGPPSDGEPDFSDDSADDEGSEPEDDERYRDMLAAATGGGGGERGAARKRRHDVLVTEAYPESEFNLNPNAATAGAATVSRGALPSVASYPCRLRGTWLKLGRVLQGGLRQIFLVFE